MFNGCSNLFSFEGASNLCTINVKDMSLMFSGSSSLSSIPDISKWNINNANDMDCMLAGCSNIIFSKIIKSKFGL